MCRSRPGAVFGPLNSGALFILQLWFLSCLDCWTSDFSVDASACAVQISEPVAPLFARPLTRCAPQSRSGPVVQVQLNLIWALANSIWATNGICLQCERGFIFTPKMVFMSNINDLSVHSTYTCYTTNPMMPYGAATATFHPLCWLINTFLSSVRWWYGPACDLGPQTKWSFVHRWAWVAMIVMFGLSLKHQAHKSRSSVGGQDRAVTGKDEAAAALRAKLRRRISKLWLMSVAKPLKSRSQALSPPLCSSW